MSIPAASMSAAMVASYAVTTASFSFPLRRRTSRVVTFRSAAITKGAPGLGLPQRRSLFARDKNASHVRPTIGLRGGVGLPSLSRVLGQRSLHASSGDPHVWSPLPSLRTRGAAYFLAAFFLAFFLAFFFAFLAGAAGASSAGISATTAFLAFFLLFLAVFFTTFLATFLAAFFLAFFAAMVPFCPSRSKRLMSVL